MPSATALRQQIEAALANRIPSALTPAPRVIRPTAHTGIPALDDALSGGLPIGAITELAGPECSGRTSLALSFIAGLTHAGRVCAWIDVSDTLHPESAAALGVDLDRLLWIRCGPQPQQLTLPGFGAHEPHISPVLADGKTAALNSKLQTLNSASLHPAPCTLYPVQTARCAEPQPKVRRHSREAVPLQPVTWNLSPDLSSARRPVPGARNPVLRKPWTRLDQALRATDLLLQAGGFSAIVLDMGSIAPEFALRVPLATWFRYRAAAERTHASVLLLTQHACTKSSAGLVLHCQPSQVDPDSTTVFTGSEHRVEITRERFAKVVDFGRRKPPQSDHSILWQSRTPWSATRPLSPEKAARK
jgi:recombination protein RecA